MSIRSAWIAVGLLLLAGCVGFGPLEIKVKPRDLAFNLPPPQGGTHVANFSSYEKLIDECGPGMESVLKMYEHRIAGVADRDQGGAIWRDFISSVLAEAMVRCLEKRPDLIPKECGHRMVARGGEIARGGDGVVIFQCGESDILPLEVTIQPLDPAKNTTVSPVRGTHLAMYSNRDKLLDECGPGAEKAWTIAFQSGDSWDAFGRIVDGALIKCLEKRNLIPAECRHAMVPVHNVPVRSFEPRVYFLCGKSADDAS